MWFVVVVVVIEWDLRVEVLLLTRVEGIVVDPSIVWRRDVCL